MDSDEFRIEKYLRIWELDNNNPVRYSLLLDSNMKRKFQSKN